MFLKLGLFFELLTRKNPHFYGMSRLSVWTSRGIAGMRFWPGTHTIIDGFESLAWSFLLFAYWLVNTSAGPCVVKHESTQQPCQNLRRLLPEHKGIISRTPGDLLLFCFWVVAVPCSDYGYDVFARDMCCHGYCSFVLSLWNASLSELSMVLFVIQRLLWVVECRFLSLDEVLYITFQAWVHALVF